MPCPTCDHTMQNIASRHGEPVFWCPRCGTIMFTKPLFEGEKLDECPKLVKRCREFEAHERDDLAQGFEMAKETLFRLHQLGIAKSIHKPEDRPQL